MIGVHHAATGRVLISVPGVDLAPERARISALIT
jgi:hypothetical protein